MSDIESFEAHQLVKQIKGSIVIESNDPNSVGKTIEEIAGGEEELLGGIQEALNRYAVINDIHDRRSLDLIQRGLNPYPCCNSVCIDNYQVTIETPTGDQTWTDSCKRKSECHGCLFQMLDSPPNHLDYCYDNEKETMPTHQEALTRLEAKGDLKGNFWEKNKECEYYKNLQSKMIGPSRSDTTIEGVTMSNFEGIVEHELHEMYNEHTPQTPVVADYTLPPACADFDFTNPYDRQIFARNLAVAIEKTMGIYPNLKVVK